MAYVSRSESCQGRASRPRQRFGYPCSAKVCDPDRIGLVIFHDTAFRIAEPSEPHDARLQERIVSLPSLVAGGYTNLTDGLRVAAQMASRAPAGWLRRIWLLTDGAPNRELEGVWSAVNEARSLKININTIGFGDPGAPLYDPDLLNRIAAATHNGRFVPVDSLRALSAALVGEARPGRRHHRPEVTVMAIDCSLSMQDPMEGKRRIDVVVEALTHLLRYKQQLFA